MKKVLMTLSLVVMSLVFTACGSKAPFKAEKPLPEAALVYIYVVDGVSDNDEASHNDYNIRINGKRYLERIESGEYMVFNLKPNATLLSVVKSQIIEQHIKLNLKAGDINYLRVTDNISYGEFAFEQVSPQEARAEISKTGLAGSNVEDPDNIITELMGTEDSQDSSIVKAKTDAIPAVSEAEIDAIIEKKLASRGVSSAVPAYIETSKLDKIKEAFEMKKQGILTDEEFKTLKAEILAK
ncbi:MAG: SHOCT domain-containing protein [Campylobacterota bacterium]|nr:SHOCT domain-containing protein [Campylobacterota bacterium]